MRVTLLPEPELEFGLGRHQDIRFGLLEHGVLDRGLTTAPTKLRLGAVGTPKTLEAFFNWVEACRVEIPAKETKLTNLFPAFPGFSENHTFYAAIVSDQTLQQPLNSRRFDVLVKNDDFNAMINEAVTVVLEAVAHIAETSNPDVIVCAMPQELRERIQQKRSEWKPGESVLEFHDLLKARGLIYRVPLQLVWPATYGAAEAKRSKGGIGGRRLQDPATIAWNLHTALYYKAGGLPYRLVRDASDFDTCFVGVSFYKSLDKSATMTSMAQVFNQRGEGVIVKGGKAKYSQEDKQNHLSETDAYTLLFESLKSYRIEHKNAPARIVLHKTTNYSSEELAGFNVALQAQDIELADLISLRNSVTRLFRTGALPPLRGTLLALTDQEHVLYTRGSIPFYKAYPGMYVPRTLNLQFDQIEGAPDALSAEVLALTKLNYNDTQLDGGAPMTVKAAKKVGEILRYIEQDVLPVSHYKFYM